MTDDTQYIRNLFDRYTNYALYRSTRSQHEAKMLLCEIESYIGARKVALLRAEHSHFMIGNLSIDNYGDYINSVRDEFMDGLDKNKLNVKIALI